jgi:hypothetical protein
MSARGPGRPKHAEATQVITLRLPAALVDRLDAWAASRGLNRNQAGAELLTIALRPPAGGYNPLTGSFR